MRKNSFPSLGKKRGLPRTVRSWEALLVVYSLVGRRPLAEKPSEDRQTRRLCPTISATLSDNLADFVARSRRDRPSILGLYIVHEGVGVGVAFVGGMLFSLRFFPSFIFGEEGIGVLWDVIYLSQAEAGGFVECLFVDAGTTYYIYVFIGQAVAQSLIE